MFTSSNFQFIIIDELQLLSPPQRFKRSLNKSAVQSVCRRKVEWIDQAENLCQMSINFLYILVVFSYINRFLCFG